VFTKLLAPAALVLCAIIGPLAFWQFGPSAKEGPSAEGPEWAVQNLPGSVVLAGGTFIDPVGAEVVRLAGGDKARLVLIPTAYGPTEEEGVEQFRELWSRWHPATISILHTRERAVANDPEFVAPLRDATAVWFLGGVQSRLIDTYAGTLLHREVQRVFERGGVVGGNCAGAMALGETMIVGGAGDDEVRLGPGLGIVPKMVADSHFLERNRVQRLRGVIAEHPDHFGIGIDGETAVVIEHGQMRFIGKSYAGTLVPVPTPQAVRLDVWGEGAHVDLSSLFACTAK